jgi:hypothetical protein
MESIMKKRILLIAALSLISINAHSAMDEVSEPQLSSIKEQIKSFSNIELVSAFDSGTIHSDYISEQDANGNYEVTIISRGRVDVSFILDGYITVTPNNQSYVAVAEHDEKWLCLTQNEPFNNCYKIIERDKNKHRICLEVD